MTTLRAALRSASTAARAALLGAALFAAACSSTGPGLNFGCGPNDPCCALGTWSFSYPALPSCGTCTGYSTTNFTLTITAAVAKNGGTITNSAGFTGLNFDPASCSAKQADPSVCARDRTFYFGSNGASYTPVFACTNSNSTACVATCTAPVVDGTPPN